MRALVRAFAVVFVFGLAGCQTAPTPEPGTGGPVNAYCAMKDNEPVDAACYVEHKGQKVAFCCSRCKGKFEDLSEAEKDARVSEVQKR